MDFVNWFQKQFSQGTIKYKRYRDVILHASFIEGICREETGEEKFFLAIKALNLSPREKLLLKEVSKKRNNLLHGLFKMSPRPTQAVIDGARDDLFNAIDHAYKKSPWLKRKLLKPYGI